MYFRYKGAENNFIMLLQKCLTHMMMILLDLLWTVLFWSPYHGNIIYHIMLILHK